jgi:hypothetical protein
MLTPSQQPPPPRPAQPERERNQFVISPLTLQQMASACLSAQQIQDALEQESGGRVAGEVVSHESK